MRWLSYAVLLLLVAFQQVTCQLTPLIYNYVLAWAPTLFACSVLELALFGVLLHRARDQVADPVRQKVGWSFYGLALLHPAWPMWWLDALFLAGAAWLRLGRGARHRYVAPIVLASGLAAMGLVSAPWRFTPADGSLLGWAYFAVVGLLVTYIAWLARRARASSKAASRPAG